MKRTQSSHRAAPDNSAKSQVYDTDCRTGRFFPVSMESVRQIRKLGAGANELGAYIVLARGAGKHISTAWTEHAVADRLGITLRRAQKACQWLEEKGLLAKNSAYGERKREAAAVAMEPEEKPPRSYGHKWLVRQAEQIIYLPNTLVDGVDIKRKMFPLRVLFDGVTIDLENGVDTQRARLDAMALLLELYAKQDIEQFGGVDPAVWCQNWATGWMEREPHLITDTRLLLIEISRGEEYISPQFVQEVFPDLADKSEQKGRFDLALQNLRELGFLYEVLQIWRDHPLDNDSATILYPLYIFDRYARENGEPALHREINRIAIEEYSDIHGIDEVFAPEDGRFLLVEDDTFRYVAFANMPNVVALSGLRLRHRAWDRENGIGWEEQVRMVQDWELELQELR